MDDPIDALTALIVRCRMGDAAGDAIVRLQAAKGGLQYLSIEQFGRYIEAIRALDRLYEAVKCP